MVEVHFDFDSEYIGLVIVALRSKKVLAPGMRSELSTVSAPPPFIPRNFSPMWSTAFSWGIPDFPGVFLTLAGTVRSNIL